MRNTFKFLLALVIAFTVMLAFRGLVMTVCMIDGDGLAPYFVAGDHVVVNRWSYGLRTGEKGGLFDYGRICRQAVKKGDFIAFEDSLGQVLICQCTALPGDTVYHTKGQAPCVVPVLALHKGSGPMCSARTGELRRSGLLLGGAYRSE